MIATRSRGTRTTAIEVMDRTQLEGRLDDGTGE